MKLLPLDRPEWLNLAADWLASPDNHQWLDFGNGRRLITPAVLSAMLRRETHVVRLYTFADGAEPIGIVGLDRVRREFGTARLWFVAGERSLRNRGYATCAASKMLTHAFEELGLHAVSLWAVEHNPAVRIIERLGFRFIGRQRLCHCIEGRLYDRLHFDLLASEHRQLELLAECSPLRQDLGEPLTTA